MTRRLVVTEMTIGVGIWVESDSDDDALEKAAERFENIKPVETVGENIAFRDVTTGRSITEDEDGLSLSLSDFIDTREMRVEDTEDSGD